MRIPSALVVTAAVLLAIPVGWGLGVVLAYALVPGRDIGVLPALTIPLATAATIILALLPSITPQRRLAIMAAAAAGFVVLSLLGA